MNLLINANSKQIPLADGSVNCVVTSPPYYFDNEAVKDVIDNPKAHEYNYWYENKSVYSVQSREASGYVQRKQSAIRRANGLLQGLSENNPQGVGQKIQHEPKRTGNCEALLLFGKGSRDEEGIQGRLRTDGGTAQEVSGGGAETRKGRKVQRKKEALRPKREGQSDQSNSGQEVCQYRERSFCETQDCNQAELSNKNNRLYIDQDGMGGNQGCIQEQMRLLRSTSGETGNGPRDTTKQRGNTYKRECSSIMPNMQCQEGGKVAGNRRSVWLISPKPYKGAHYATFPPKLIEPMILAGCPAGGIVLDPFVGSGTTVMVANQLGRNGIGLDLNFQYLRENAKKRLEAVQPILLT